MGTNDIEIPDFFAIGSGVPTGCQGATFKWAPGLGTCSVTVSTS